MSSNLSQLEPELEPFARALVSAAAAAGLLPQVTSTRRSYWEQTRLYRRALAGLNPYPVARPGESPHEYGWAFDLIVSPRDWIDSVGQLWEQWGGVWGGRWGDEVHFELPGASQRAKSLATDPATRKTTYGEDALNFVIGLIPVIGWVQMAASLMQLFPELSKNEALIILSEPTRYPSYIRALASAYR